MREIQMDGEEKLCFCVFFTYYYHLKDKKIILLFSRDPLN